MRCRIDGFWVSVVLFDLKIFKENNIKTFKIECPLLQYCPYCILFLHSSSLGVGESSVIKFN